MYQQARVPAQSTEFQRPLDAKDSRFRPIVHDVTTL